MDAQLKDETLCDSIVEMRDLAEHRDWHNHTSQSNRERVSYLADRIDRARMKMEIEMANLRKENVKLREFARLVSHMNDDGYWNGSASIGALVGNAKVVLAATSNQNTQVAKKIQGGN